MESRFLRIRTNIGLHLHELMKMIFHNTPLFFVCVHMYIYIYLRVFIYIIVVYFGRSRIPFGVVILRTMMCMWNVDEWSCDA